MHRTTGEDYIIEGGKRRYAAANPPSQKATRLPAEDMNAIQEEICNVITAAGLTLEDTAADDRTTGWIQLLLAIQYGHLVKHAGLDDTAVATIIAHGTGFTELLNTRTAIEGLRKDLDFPFQNVPGSLAEPLSSGVPERISLSILAQAMGAERVFIISDNTSDTVDLQVGGSYGEAWDGDVMIIINSNCTLANINIDGVLPRSRRVTLVSDDWGPTTESDGSGHSGQITCVASGTDLKLRSNSILTLFTYSDGSILKIFEESSQGEAYNGTPAFFSRLHGIRDMQMADVETPITLPAKNNTYPFPLLDLSQSSTTIGGTLGGGVRVAGDAGIELPMSSVSRLGTSRKRSTARLYHSLDGDVMVNLGQDSLGNERGHVQLDDQVEAVLRHYRTLGSSYGVGGIGLFSLIGDSTRFNLSPLTRACATGQIALLFQGLSLGTGVSAVLNVTLRVWNCDGTNDYTDLTSENVTVSASGGPLKTILFHLARTLISQGKAIEPILHIVSITGGSTIDITSVASSLEFTRAPS